MHASDDIVLDQNKISEDPGPRGGEVFTGPVNFVTDLDAVLFQLIRFGTAAVRIGEGNPLGKKSRCVSCPGGAIISESTGDYARVGGLAPAPDAIRRVAQSSSAKRGPTN